MTPKTGKIRISVTPAAKSLALIGPSDTPPHEPVVLWSISPIPAWIWEAAQGNAGATGTVTFDAAGNPTGFVVS